MVNIERLISKKLKSGNDAGSSRQGRGKFGSSVRRYHPCAHKESSRLHLRHQGIDISGCPQRESGLEPAPLKHTKPTNLEPVHPEKGKALCPHHYTTDPSKNLWDYPEIGVDLIRHHIRDADVAYLGPCSTKELVDLAFSSIARIPAMIQALGNKARAYEKMRAKAEEYEKKCHSLTWELAQLKFDHDISHKKLEEEMSSVKEELKAEVSSGRGLFESPRGQRFMQLHDEGVISAFKASDAFTEAVEDASVSVFDECVTYCQERLINSGRFPGEKFEFLDPAWVELIEGSPLMHSTVARASQGTSLLQTAPQNYAMDSGGEDAT